MTAPAFRQPPQIAATPLDERSDMPRVVVVVGDGSDPCPDGRDAGPASLGAWLDEDAALIQERTGLSVRAVPLIACDAEDLTAQMRALTADAGAIFLTRTDPARARAARLAFQEVEGPPVVTDADVTAINLTATLLTAIARAGHQPADGRVVVAGADMLPELCPLLIAAGVGDISSWNVSDAHAFPLRQLARYATAVVDLVNAAPRSGHDWQAIIRPDEPGLRMLPVPGLVLALASHPHATVDIDVSRAGALALAAATSPGRRVPDGGDPHLAETVSAAVLRILARRPPCGGHGAPSTSD